MRTGVLSRGPRFVVALASGLLLSVATSAAVGVVGVQPSPSPLLEALYQASRQVREKDAAPLLEQALDLVTQGADVKVVGRERRTALHWTVIGALTVKTQKQVRAYQDLVEQLIVRGADVNAEDDFGATPLDYQENASTTTEITFLLLDNGARNGSAQQGSATRVVPLLNTLEAASQAGDLDKIRAALAFDLPIGTAVPLRITTSLSTNTSRAGDVIEAVVTAPVLVEHRLVMAAGTRMRGTVMLSLKATNDYERAQLILCFAEIVHQDGSRTQVATELVDVDNAREAVQSGRVVGVPHPNTSRVSWALRAVGVTDPILARALQSALLVRDREYKRAIEYPAGTDMTVTIQQPVTFGPALPSPDAVVMPTPAPPALVDLVQSQPLRTETTGGAPSDLTNMIFIGSRDRVGQAFQAAGWSEAEHAGMASGLKTFAAVAESRGYRNAPVSLLLLEGQKPDVVYQRQTNTFARRHHIRVWRTPARFQQSEVWIAAATHDIGVAVRKGGREWYHRIDGHVDRERAKVTNDLDFAGVVAQRFLVDRPAAPRETANATGDRVVTDGRMAVLVLR